MPRSLSIVPEPTSRDVYLVLDDFGTLGRVWRETDEAGTNRTWMIRNLRSARDLVPRLGLRKKFNVDD